MNGNSVESKMAVDVDENMREMYSVAQKKSSNDVSNVSKRSQHLSDIQNTSKNGRSGRRAGLKRSATSGISCMYILYSIYRHILNNTVIINKLSICIYARVFRSKSRSKLHFSPSDLTRACIILYIVHKKICL